MALVVNGWFTGSLLADVYIYIYMGFWPWYMLDNDS